MNSKNTKKDKNNPENFISVRFFKWFDKMKEDKVRFIALIILTFIVCVYLSSLFSQLTSGGFYVRDKWGNGEKISAMPFSTIPKMIARGHIMYPVYMMGLIAVGLYFLKLKVPSDRYDERGFTISEDGTYGTSGWMTKDEYKEEMLIADLKTVKGPVFGLIPDSKDVLSFRLKPEYEGDLRPYRFNKNAAIYGASGSGKSRAYVRNQIMQCVRRGESVVITDPKSEMYASMAGFLEDQGYKVRVFNLINPELSDSWNAVNEVMSTPDQLELMAQTFASVVIANTIGEGGKADHFWDNAEMNLLKALLLYIICDESRNVEDKNFGEVYRLITEVDANRLEAMFEALPPSHPAKQPWNIFIKAGPQVKGNVIIGLGSRLQVFQAESIRKLTADIDIDLTAPGKEKTAIFLIMSDQDGTLNFLSSLFFSFIFIKLVRYADLHGKGGKLDVPVNFILDEFPNIGRIPDFEKKISTVRSRDINISLIFQNLAQLQNRYPQGTWEEILGNCDAQLFLGCTDQLTAEYVSKRTGELTVDVSSTQVQRQAIAITDSIPTYRSTDSVGKRMLLTPDEVLRLPNSECLLIARGCKVIKLNKLDYSLHPDSKMLRDTPIQDFVPYRKKEAAHKASEKAAKAQKAGSATPPVSNIDKEKKTSGWSVDKEQNQGSQSSAFNKDKKPSWEIDNNMNNDSSEKKDDKKGPMDTLEETLRERMAKRKFRPTFDDVQDDNTFKPGSSNLG